MPIAAVAIQPSTPPPSRDNHQRAAGGQTANYTSSSTQEPPTAASSMSESPLLHATSNPPPPSNSRLCSCGDDQLNTPLKVVSTIHWQWRRMSPTPIRAAVTTSSVSRTMGESAHTHKSQGLTSSLPQ
ncbi:hypothetical protein TcWFU_009729 [Taenia crassiceps]|uniref:Uncharacterized protein n=1 Tax=Taenia crassiceps TaxID=6207 RepID=A0ABR4QJ54_9CEST